MSDGNRSMPGGVLLAIALLAPAGLAALINGITGSAELAWISYVVGFGFLLAKGDDIFKAPSARPNPGSRSTTLDQDGRQTSRFGELPRAENWTLGTQPQALGRSEPTDAGEVEQGVLNGTDSSNGAQEPEAQAPPDPGRLTVSKDVTELLERLQESANEHDENGVCRHCQVSPDHPVFEGWKKSFSPGEVERLVAERQKPHRIVDGACKNCAHDAGKSWTTRMKELDDPTRLADEHARGEHDVPRACCPKCEAESEARETERRATQAEWQAVHGGEGHECPDCEDERLWQLDREHQRGKHTVHVPGCEQCQFTLDRARAVAAHARGEHESFDFRDKNAVAPCSECRVNQWHWYEQGLHSVDAGSSE